MSKSPLAPTTIARLLPVKGVRIAAVSAGLTYQGRKDLSILVFDQPATVAGVFTRSKCASAPVEWCKEIITSGVARGLVVNAGNANAFTGIKGARAAQATAKAAANAIGCQPEEIYIASTGVIGELLDVEKFSGKLSQLVVSASADNWAEMADAIMTTDTFAKLATQQFGIDGQSFTLNGIAKGSGMIAPDMATMLSFLVTDLPVSATCLQSLLSARVGATYNAITVDSDTSTSDTVLLFATGGIDGFDQITDLNDPRLAAFGQALSSVMHNLALQIVRDGEGAQKLIEILVTGARDDRAAKTIAFSIANSPLVKTAIAGEDANWGRIVMAVGKAGEEADRDRLSIWFDDIRVAHNGERDVAYDEAATTDVMKKQKIDIRVDLALGDGQATVWTCDLTHDYISINADYRS